jgi:RNA polymerase sigma-70 factor (ECF subfamily)
MTLEEVEWVQKLKQGDQKAASSLLCHYRGRVVRLAARTLGRESEAEDVAQDAFIQAFRNIGSLHDNEAFSTWLYRIVVRLCVDRSRRFWWSREKTVERGLENRAAQSGEIETQIVTRQLLDKLSPVLRATLVLRLVEELEYEEISKILGIPVGTVKSRLAAARTQFRQLWREAGNETKL